MIYDLSFPDDISLNSLKTVNYSTDVFTTLNGHEYRQSHWDKPRSHYTINFMYRKQQDIQRLIHFFNLVKGKAIGFRFKDWSDYIAEEQFGMVQPKTTLQLYKTYSFNEQSTTKTIKKIINSPNNKFYLDTKLLNKHEYELNLNTGEFNLLTSVGGELSGHFEFETLVRFDTDRLPIEIHSDQLFSVNNLPLIEIRS